MSDVDAAARGVVERAGRGEQFVHPLGHGVGLQIHEAPLLAATPAGMLAAGMAVTVELVGVLVVGAWSLLDPGAFPEATVWSGFGRGYGFVPLVLPVLGLAWLWRTRLPTPPVDAPAGATS